MAWQLVSSRFRLARVSPFLLAAAAAAAGPSSVCAGVEHSNLARASDPAGDLLEGAASGDVPRICSAVAAGASLDAPGPDGRTALVLATAGGHFGAARELLWLGANPAVKTATGKVALDFVGEDLPLRMLLRCYVFMRERGRVTSARPARPELVMLFEPTVNYMHPALKPAYYVNDAEVAGQAGVDDDHDGFVDDAYGLNLESGRGHFINEMQLQTYRVNRAYIAELFEFYNQHRLGRIPDDAFQERMAGMDNPLAKLFGNNSGFTTARFLDLALELAHGSHVAGIVLENSLGSAKLHTMSWEGFGDSEGHVSFSPEFLRRAAAESRSYEGLMTRVRAQLLEESFAQGQLASAYIRITGAGVVNMSMGLDIGGFFEVATNIARDYYSSTGTVFQGSMDQLGELVRQIAFELYVAKCSTHAAMFYENPDVLFVVAAGNEQADNDQVLTAPAYLARFFPNVITVAAVDKDDRAASFTNFGQTSVDIGALGVSVLSTVIPETNVLMDGTSMAAPAVAGAAAHVRKVSPSTSAVALRRLLEGTARGDSLRGMTTSGGVLDAAALFRAVEGSPRERATELARAAGRAAEGAGDAWPDGLVVADELSRQALELDPAAAESQRERAVYLDHAGRAIEAVAFLDKAVALAPDDLDVWRSRCAVLEELGRLREAIAAADRMTAIAEADHAHGSGERAKLYALRARLRLANGDAAGARGDATTARALDASVELPEALAALIVR